MKIKFNEHISCAHGAFDAGQVVGHLDNDLAKAFVKSKQAVQVPDSTPIAAQDPSEKVSVEEVGMTKGVQSEPKPKKSKKQ